MDSLFRGASKFPKHGPFQYRLAVSPVAYGQRCQYDRIWGILGDKLGAILKTPLMRRGHLDAASLR